MPFISPRSFTTGVVAVLVFLPHAVRAGLCERRLDPVQRLFPWPDADADLISALRIAAKDPALRVGTRAALDAALARGAPDFVVRAIMRPAGPPARGGDPDGLREILAGAVGAIRDHAIRDEWMSYLADDPVATVRIAAARAFLSWRDQARRDAFVEASGLGEREQTERLLAAKSGLARLSPPVRWRVIKRLVETLDRPDDDVAAALGDFDDPALLYRWHADLMRGRYVIRAISDVGRESPALRDARRGPAATGDAPRYHAQLVGYALSRIAQLNTRYKIETLIMECARGRDATAKFAREVMAWLSVWTSIYREMLDREIGRPTTEDEALRRLRERTFDDRSFEIACVARQRALARPFEPLRPWREEDISAFEARLAAAAQNQRIN